MTLGYVTQIATKTPAPTFYVFHSERELNETIKKLSLEWKGAGPMPQLDYMIDPDFKAGVVYALQDKTLIDILKSQRRERQKANASR